MNWTRRAGAWHSKSTWVATKLETRYLVCYKDPYPTNPCLGRTKSLLCACHLPTMRAMKAVILAAGRGTRMRDLTNELPKPMLKVMGVPILEHIIQGLVSNGVQEIFIVTGFRADVIEAYFGG